MTTLAIIIFVIDGLMAVLISILFSKLKKVERQLDDDIEYLEQSIRNIERSNVTASINEDNELILTYNGNEFYNWKIDKK